MEDESENKNSEEYESAMERSAESEEKGNSDLKHISIEWFARIGGQCRLGRRVRIGDKSSKDCTLSAVPDVLPCLAEEVE